MQSSWLWRWGETWGLTPLLAKTVAPAHTFSTWRHTGQPQALSCLEQRPPAGFCGVSSCWEARRAQGRASHAPRASTCRPSSGISSSRQARRFSPAAIAPSAPPPPGLLRPRVTQKAVPTLNCPTEHQPGASRPSATGAAVGHQAGQGWRGACYPRAAPAPSRRAAGRWRIFRRKTRVGRGTSLWQVGNEVRDVTWWMA